MQLTVLFSLSLICSSPARTDEDDPRIVGGFEANKEDYPYVVSLRSSHNQHFCGGTLINPQYVITAAHCIKGGHARSVVVGGDSLDSGGASYLVISSRIHPDYNATSVRNDIAILKIDRAATYKSSFPPRMQTNLSDFETPCLVMGWGLTSAGGHLSKKFKVAAVQPVAPSRCEEEWKEMYNANLICTKSEESAACQGDSGGPLICEDHLAGVVSFGKPCATGKPDVFTSVRAYEEWIDSMIEG